jgi:hypothetical protein
MSLSEEHESAEPWFSRTVTSGRWLSPFIPSEWEVSAATSQLWHNERCEKGIFILAPMVGKKRSQEEEATAEDAERNSGQPRIYGFRGVHVFDRVVAEYQQPPAVTRVALNRSLCKFPTKS